MANAIFSKMSEELTAEILSRLPPKSLMRFKCVRKSWCFLITNPNFVAMHLSNFNSTNNKLCPSTTTILFRRFVLEDFNTGKKEILLSSFNLCFDVFDDVDTDGGDHDHDHLPSVLEDLKIPPSMGLKTRGNFMRVRAPEISNHCDGIVCLFDRKKIALCNPAIKEFKLLPDFDKKKEKLLPDSTPDQFPTVGVGVGYDHHLTCAKKNYKVVRIVTCGCKDHGDDHRELYPPRAEVYTLGTNAWKEIEIGNIETKAGFLLPHYIAGPIYHKGVLYWVAVEHEKEYDEVNFTDVDEDEDAEPKEINSGILSFDFSDEVFDFIPYPPDVWFNEDQTFAVWNESIALSTHTLETGCVDIWVMDDSDGVKGLWIKYFTFEPEVRLVLLALRKSNDQVVLVLRDDCVVMFYNISRRKFKYLPINGVFLDDTQAVVCVNSIVSIKGDDEV